jgi:hypothetical protein
MNCPECKRGTLMPRKLPRTGAHYHQCDRCGWQTGMRFAELHRQPKPSSNWGEAYVWIALALVVLLFIGGGDGGGVGHGDMWRGGRP